MDIYKNGYMKFMQSLHHLLSVILAWPKNILMKKRIERSMLSFILLSCQHNEQPLNMKFHISTIWSRMTYDMWVPMDFIQDHLCTNEQKRHSLVISPIRQFYGKRLKNVARKLRFTKIKQRCVKFGLQGMLISDNAYISGQVLRLKMFREDHGSWMTMFFSTILFLFIFSHIYNTILLMDGNMG